MNNKETNNRVNQILSSLDANQRASAPDFFYTRLKARMEKELEPQNKNNKIWMLRPAYAIAALIVVLVINVAVILKEEPSTEINNNSDSETEQSIAAEYSLNDNNIIYDLTPDK